VSPECVLGLDLGTTTCRAMAFDREGRLLAEARHEVEVASPAPGQAEVHASWWWDAACLVLREVVGRLRASGSTPVALGLCGLQHALVPIGEHGEVLGPTLLWMDQRCQDEVDWLNSAARGTLEAAAGPGARATTTPSLPRLRWMARHMPEIVAQTRCFLLPKDYVRYRLTGAIGTDPTDAGGTMLYDSRAGAWSPALVELAMIRPDQLPPLYPSDAVAGTVTAEAAAASGLPTGLPVVVGMGDTAATRLGSVGTDPAAALIYVGTAAWVNWPGRANRGCMLATTATGAALRWLRDVLSAPGAGLTYEALLAEASSVPAGSQSLLFLPHLCGERGPFPNPRARGVFTGLTLHHARGHLVRAVVEGTCCHVRWLVEEGGVLAADRIWAAGGAAHSAFWMQLLADVLARDLHTPEIVEAGALGGAVLAAVGATWYPDRAAAAAAMVHAGPVYRSDATMWETYDGLYARWRLAEDLYAPAPQ